MEVGFMGRSLQGKEDDVVGKETKVLHDPADQFNFLRNPPQSTNPDIPLIHRFSRQRHPLTHLSHPTGRALLHCTTQEQERPHRIRRRGRQRTPAERRSRVRASEELREQCAQKGG